MTLCEADITTKIQVNSKNTTTILKLFEENRSRRAIVRNFQPPITGEEIMEIFNLKPSKEIGMLKEAKEAILEGEIANEYQAAYDFMLKGLRR
jgi:tRNA nucleotidyltransferase (CCA-adding enzyme)